MALETAGVSTTRLSISNTPLKLLRNASYWVVASATSLPTPRNDANSSMLSSAHLHQAQQFSNSCHLQANSAFVPRALRWLQVLTECCRRQSTLPAQPPAWDNHRLQVTERVLQHPRLASAVLQMFRLCWDGCNAVILPSTPATGSRLSSWSS